MITDEELSSIDKLTMPGSELAIQAGCTCDAKKNNNGKGYKYRDGRGYVIDKNCPLYMHRKIGEHELAE